MGTFVTGNTALPTPKVDAFPPQGSPSELDAADINSIWSALADLRAHTLGFTLITEWGADPAASAAANTTAIQNALNSGAARVVVPAGLFNHNGLTVPTGVVLEGFTAGKSMLQSAAAGPSITLNGCQLSEVKNLRIITTSTDPAVRGVWLRNAGAASQWNTVENCVFIQNSATPRATGQVGVLIEDDSATVAAQFWNTVEKNRFLSWETPCSVLQSGAGLDGVNQSAFINNMAANFLTALRINPRCGDHFVAGFFGSHSSPDTFTDVIAHVGDVSPGTGNSAGNLLLGLISDMGANGSAFLIENHSTGNIVLSDNESAGTDQNLGDSTNILISNKGVSPTGRNLLSASSFLSGANSMSGSFFLGQALRATGLVVITNGGYTVVQSDLCIAFKGATAAHNLQLGANPGQLLVVGDQDGSASGTNTITALPPAGGTVDGLASKVIINSAGGSALLFPVSADGKTWKSFRST